jgi:error-prone DNA polymerase
MTIEDEFGFVNLVIFEKLFETYRKAILQSKLILVEGKLQIEGAVIHVIVQECHDISRLLRQLTQSGKKEWPAIGLSRADEGAISPPDTRTPKNKQEESLFPGARNFR